MPTNNIGIEGMEWDGNDWIEAPPASPPSQASSIPRHEITAAVLAEWKRTLEPQFDKALYWTTDETNEQFKRLATDPIKQLIHTRQRGE